MYTSNLSRLERYEKPLVKSFCASSHLNQTELHKPKQDDNVSGRNGKHDRI